MGEWHITKPMGEEIIDKLADEWRSTENYFIENEDDCMKWEAMRKQEEAKLNKEELKALEEVLDSMGI